MKKESVLTLVSVILVVVVCLVLWKDVIFKPKTTPVYRTKVLVITPNHDTIFNKTIISDTPLKFK